MSQTDQRAAGGATTFSQPIRAITTMLLVCALVGAGAWLIYGQIVDILRTNPVLNGVIALVFLFGVLSSFWQVWILAQSVYWIENFVQGTPGTEDDAPPRLLAPLAALLRSRSARMSISASSSRSIQDSVVQRIDEARDITRYLINLLVFLGLLGTFWGLATTVPAVVETIRSLAPQEGESGLDVFGKLMGGLESQLGGMGTAFSSSLLGLAGSLVLGLLELFAGHGQNRFIRELEEWLSSITRLGYAGDGDGADQSALGLLVEPGGVVAFVGDASAAVQLQDPAGDVVEEIAVVGDDQDRALVVDQVLLQPGDGFGVKVVGRFVQEEHVGLFEKQAAERDAAAFPARQGGDIGIVRRAAQRVHRDADGGLKLPQVLGVDLILQGGHLVRRLVRVVHREFVVAVQDLRLRGHAQHDVFLGGELGVKLRFLCEIADLGALGGPGLAFEVGVDPGHDLEERGFPRAVDADDTDLDAGQEVQVDVLEALLAAGVGLGDVLHVVDVLVGGHVSAPSGGCRVCSEDGSSLQRS